MQFIQVHIVGDEGVGKTSLIRCYSGNSFENDAYEAEDDSDDASSQIKELVVNDHSVKLSIFESECKQNLEHRRLRSYKQADVFIICFSVIR